MLRSRSLSLVLAVLAQVLILGAGSAAAATMAAELPIPGLARQLGRDQPGSDEHRSRLEQLRR